MVWSSRYDSRLDAMMRDQGIRFRMFARSGGERPVIVRRADAIRGSEIDTFGGNPNPASAAALKNRGGGK
jgi:hypothetical protein